MSERQLTQPAELDEAAHVLARAFATDPMYDFVLGDVPDRAQRTAWLMRRFVEYSVREGAVVGVGAPLQGVVMYVDAPAGYTLSTWQLIRAGMAASPWKLGMGALLRLMRLGDQLDEVHHRTMTQPHRFIFYVGVDPVAQGRGLGKGLLVPKIREARAQGRPLYLDTHKERNVALYASLGFRVVHEAPPGRGGPRAWSMVHDE